MPGNKVVYVKNTDYVPRKEPPTWASGGKVVKVDRVEWLYIPDAATAAAALNAGEVDWWQQLPPDLVPLLSKNKDIMVATVDPLGIDGRAALQPPAAAVQQSEDAPGAALRRRPERLCCGASPAIQELASRAPSLFTCGTPMAKRGRRRGPDGQARPRRRPRQLMKEAGYKGEKIVVLSATDQPIVHSQALVDRRDAAEHRRSTSTCSQRLGHADQRGAPSRSRSTRAAGTSSITWLVGPDMANPAINYPLRGDRREGVVRLADRHEIEELRDAWFDATDAAPSRRRSPTNAEARMDSVPFIPTGQFVMPDGLSRNISGPDRSAPIAFLVERREES